MRANFEQYGLIDQFIDVAVCDSSNPPWRGIKFQAIITDPPYGIREPTERVGASKKKNGGKIPEEYLDERVPQKVNNDKSNALKYTLNSFKIIS